MITHREQRVAETLAYRLPGVLTRRGLKAPIRQFLLSEVNGLKMLIAEVDLGGVNYPERYTTPEVLSHLVSVSSNGSRRVQLRSNGDRLCQSAVSVSSNGSRRVQLTWDIPALSSAKGFSIL